MIKAINTQYKGYRFRSRLEARWAVYFDAIGIKWEYEKEGYDLGASNGLYLPDFWLPQVDMWAEVKAKKFTKYETRKALCLSTQSGFPVIALVGTPDCLSYAVIDFALHDECDGHLYDLDTWNWNDVYLDSEYLESESRFYSMTGHGAGVPDEMLGHRKEIARAVKAARSVRFEHGESPR